MSLALEEVLQDERRHREKPGAEASGFCSSDEPVLPEAFRSAYDSYLKLRRRPAAELLIKRGDADSLDILQSLGLLDEKYIDEYCALAVREGQLQVLWKLIYRKQRSDWSDSRSVNQGQKRKPSCEKELVSEIYKKQEFSQRKLWEVNAQEAEHQDTDTQEARHQKMNICKAEEEGSDIWQIIQKKAALSFPFLLPAFYGLYPRADSAIKRFGTDGQYLYYNPLEIRKLFLQNNQKLLEGYIHTVLHCLYLHVFSGIFKEEEVWNLCCDIYVECICDEHFFKRKQSALRKKWYDLWKQSRCLISPDALMRWFQKEALSNEKIQELESEFMVDSHIRWKLPGEDEALQSRKGSDKKKVCGRDSSLCLCRQSSNKQKLQYLRLVQKKAEFWKRTMQRLSFEEHKSEKRAGAEAGNQWECISLKQRKEYDYRRFLRRFFVFGEEVQLDLEQFDYIPYSYSREHYENLVFLEALEYAEVYRLQELVIAIDTSGSCRGSVVQQFLEETYQIMSRRENFFQKMRVHIIQCDSMIQGYACIENEEQWKEYVKNLRVQGFGGTDFRPVFELVEKLRQKREIQKLKGLLYFTDGDGIYPRRAPDYETAFVFLNKDYEKGEVPFWALKLNLNLRINEVLEETGF